MCAHEARQATGDTGMATAAESKAKAVAAAEKKVAVAQKQFDRAQARVASVEALSTARDAAQEKLRLAAADLDWQRSRPLAGGDSAPAAGIDDAPDPDEVMADAEDEEQ